MKMTKGKKITFWILGVLLFFIIGTVGGVYIYANSLFNKMEKVEINKDNVGISQRC